MSRTSTIVRCACVYIALAGACRPDLDGLTSGNGEGVGGSSASGGKTDAGVAGCINECAAGTDGGGRSGSPGSGGSSGDGGDAAEAGAGGTSEDCLPRAPVGEAPIVLYGFEEGSGSVVADSSSEGNDGVLSDGSWIENGRDGAGLEFDAPSEFVTLPEDVLAGLEVITVSTWMKLNDNPVGATLFDFGPDAANHLYLTTNTGAGMRFGGAAGGEDQGVSVGRTLPLGVWKHVAAVVSDGGAALYVDGLEVARSEFSVNLSDLGAATSNWIGKSHAGATGLFAALDDFRIYDRALSAPEIADLALPGEDYLHFTFDETCGQRAHDRSARALIGELPEGGSWVAGRVGGALELNGSDQYVVLPPAIVANCRELTLAFWTLRTMAGRTREHIVDFGQNQRTFLYVTPQAPTGGLRFATKLNGPENDVTAEQALFTSTALAVGPWQHVAVVLRSGSGQLYLDGVQVDARPIAIRPADLGATTANAVGRSQYHAAAMPDPFYAGRIDELRISCRAFTPEEVAFLALLP